MVWTLQFVGNQGRETIDSPPVIKLLVIHRGFRFGRALSIRCAAGARASRTCPRRTQNRARKPRPAPCYPPSRGDSSTGDARREPLRRPHLTRAASIRGCVLLACVGAASVCCSSPSLVAEDDAATLGKDASDLCEARGTPQGLPTRAFTTDVCSVFFDGSWGECCVAHDRVYWCGGTRSDRRRADRELRECVTARVRGWRGAWLGHSMEIGTFFGGVPWLPTPWRWGYGHAYPSGYAADSAD